MKKKSKKYPVSIRNHQTSGTDNPSTLVHSMVEYLWDLKK
jgi:hypothetical protein